MPEVRAGLRVLLRLLSVHRQPQLGPPHHPPHPPVRHHRMPLHRPPLHHQVQGDQGIGYVQGGYTTMMGEHHFLFCFVSESLPVCIQNAGDAAKQKQEVMLSH